MMEDGGCRFALLCNAFYWMETRRSQSSIATMDISITAHGHSVRDVARARRPHDKTVIHDTACGIVAFNECDLRDE